MGGVYIPTLAEWVMQDPSLNLKVSSWALLLAWPELWSRGLGRTLLGLSSGTRVGLAVQPACRAPSGV